MSIVLRTVLLPIVATALVCQPQLAPDAMGALLRTTMQVQIVAQVLSRAAIRLPAVLLEQFNMTRKSSS